MNFRQLLEEEAVRSHRVEYARCGERHAVDRAEDGNQDSERHQFGGICTEDGSD